eukprot:UN07657
MNNIQGIAFQMYPLLKLDILERILKLLTNITLTESNNHLCTGKIITKTSFSRNKKYFLEKMKALLIIFLTKTFSGTNDFV